MMVVRHLRLFWRDLKNGFGLMGQGGRSFGLQIEMEIELRLGTVNGSSGTPGSASIGFWEWAFNLHICRPNLAGTQTYQRTMSKYLSHLP